MPNAIGKVLYDAVLEQSAKEIVDVGILHGYSTVCLAMAAKQTGGKVYAYDLFEDYQYNSPNKEQTRQNFIRYGVEDIIVMKKLSLDDWLKTKQQFDILHIDVSNTGETIQKVYEHFKGSPGRVFFEGGSASRDLKQDWMNKYGMKKFSDMSKEASFKVLKENIIKSKNGRVFYPCISELFLSKNKG
jgi:hypothetical protein